MGGGGRPQTAQLTSSSVGLAKACPNYVYITAIMLSHYKISISHNAWLGSSHLQWMPGFKGWSLSYVLYLELAATGVKIF